MKLTINRTAFLCFALAFMVSLLAGCAAPAAKPEKIVFAVQSAKPEDTRAAWQPLVDDLGKQLGVPIELLALGQAETVAALANGQADVVWLSSRRR